MEQRNISRPRLLIFLEWFTPAYKAGGPIRSIINLVELLADDIDIYICTGDRDLGDDRPFQDIVFNQWIQHEKYSIMYCDRKHQTPQSVLKIINSIIPDTVYLNSMYGYRFSLLPLYMLRRNGFKGRIILAPRGMLRATALRFKSVKKKTFLFFLRSSGFLHGVFFHATDAQEESDIRKWLKAGPQQIITAANAHRRVDHLTPVEKCSGEVRLLFVGRIHPIKGLDLLLQVMQRVTANVTLDIVGWIENKAYYQQCLDLIKKLPENIKVIWSGDMEFSQIISHYHKAHMFVLPTHGENFGHAIFEALSFGRPVIISDETPWKQLREKRVGWDISLKKPDEWLSAIQDAADMDQATYDVWRDATYAYAGEFILNSKVKQKYGELIEVSL